ncbi:MAG TPA: DMT family transporter, partial [Jatrophihabitans sp.]|nr:DMT family transporter [Jatrophihabitans sp.]
MQSAASRPEPPAGTTAIGARTESLALPPARDAGLLLIALAGVSASGPIMAATAAPALAIAFWRNALGSVSTMLLTGPRLRATLLAPDRRGWAVSAVAGVFLALHFGTWVPSVKFTSVASATGLVATQSIFAGLVAAAAGRRLPRLAWMGMLLAFVGTLFIAGADFQVSARALAGDGLAVLGGLFAALYITAGGHARQRMSAASYTIICYSTCSVGLLLV